jgi:hypothetical protein
MPRRDTRDQAARFIELKRQVIATTGLPEDAPRVAYLAVLALRAERIQEAAINGDDIDVAELLALKDTIEQLSPAPVHNVSIQVCRKLHGVCQRCGFIQETDEAVPSPGSSPDPPLHAVPSSVAPPASDADAVLRRREAWAGPPLPANVVPINRDHEFAPARDIHSGRYSCAKGYGADHGQSDPYVGSFSMPSETRDPHRHDNVMPAPLPPKDDAS